jgi:hypothetical protein
MQRECYLPSGVAEGKASMGCNFIIADVESIGTCKESAICICPERVFQALMHRLSCRFFTSLLWVQKGGRGSSTFLI